jgi:uncharacterized circularly permuted ATP-grasp superfamily protein
MLGCRAGASRAVGRIAIANALGSGLVESAAIAAFCRAVPPVARRRAEDSSVATWWCGQQGPFITWLRTSAPGGEADLPSFSQQPVFGAKLSEKKRRSFDRMPARPEQFVAQEQVSLSTVPVWDEGQLHPRHMVLGFMQSRRATVIA